VTDDAHGDLPADLFTTIDHVGIAVPDLREAIAFYELGSPRCTRR
jgi:methylmalonyl-CoA/ethylmalonyl-CoA epimerase